MKKWPREKMVYHSVLKRQLLGIRDVYVVPDFPSTATIVYRFRGVHGTFLSDVAIKRNIRVTCGQVHFMHTFHDYCAEWIRRSARQLL